MQPRPLVLALAGFAAVLALTAAPGRALALTKAQQKCVNTHNGGLQKLSATISAELLACAKDYANGKNGVTDVTACTASDRKGKIAKATQRLSSDWAKSCMGNDRNGDPKAPGIFATSSSRIAVAAYAKEQALFRDLFGAGPNGTLATAASDAHQAACQLAVSKHVKACQDTKVKEFVKCAKSALAGGASDAAALEACILADPKGVIAKACDLPAKPDPIRKDLEKKCAGAIAGSAFPQCPSPTVDGVHDCLETPVECIACKAINLADDLAADCDQLDDGVVNQSCSLCGDSVVDPGEDCDVSNVDGQTCESLGFPGGGFLGCTSSCVFDTSLCHACSVSLCPGYGQPNDNVTCQNFATCTFSCQGENYDVNDDPGDGCEVTDVPTGNHTPAGATSLGVVDTCDTSMPTLFSGLVVSDTRVHEQPAVVGFDTFTGSAPDFLKVTAPGSIFCLNDVVLTLTVTSAYPTCYRLSVSTDLAGTLTCQTNAAGTCTIYHNTGGQFTDGSTIGLKVEKTCSASQHENAAYSIAGHF
jgi:hypothetical protein